MSFFLFLKILEIKADLNLQSYKDVFVVSRTTVHKIHIVILALTKQVLVLPYRIILASLFPENVDSDWNDSG